MKKAIIIALVCVNIALLAGLMLGTSIQPAKAQAYGPKYLMITGLVRTNQDAVYVLDVQSQRLIALEMDRREGLQARRGRLLTRDFGRQGNR